MKTVVITGASGSLGSAIIARLLENNDCRIIAISRKPISMVNSNRISNLLIDLNKVSSIKKNIRNYIGNSRVDCLINCAGICKSIEFTERDIDSIIKQINVNLTSYIVLCKLLLDNMTSGSHIVNISSLMGRIPAKYYTVYSATKFGLVGFSESLRLELKDSNIKVSCVLPSLFESRMADNAKVPTMIKPATADDIAKEVVSLLYRHEGIKTIGLQSILSCIVERLMPAINRNISRSV